MKITAWLLVAVLLCTCFTACGKKELKGTYKSDIGSSLTFDGNQVWGYAAVYYVFPKGTTYTVEEGKMRFFEADGTTLIREFPYREARDGFVLTMLDAEVVFTREKQGQTEN